MTSYRSFTRRLLAAATLAVALLGTATLSVPAASADPAPRGAPTISPLHVQPGGTEAMVRFTTSEPTTVVVDYRPAGVTPLRQPQAVETGVAAAAPSRVPAVIRQEGSLQHLLRASSSHEQKLTGLTSNTAYEVSVTATTEKGQRLTAETRFTTLKERIRVTLRQITIEDDGDLIGNGEPSWLVALGWAGGSVADCYPNPGSCDPGSYPSGSIVPRNASGGFLTWIFAQENFDRLPQTLTLKVYPEESDSIAAYMPAFYLECFTGLMALCLDGTGLDETRWQRPQGMEWSSETVSLRADLWDQGFKSSLVFTVETFHDNRSYPAPKRNAPNSTWK